MSRVFFKKDHMGFLIKPKEQPASKPGAKKANKEHEAERPIVKQPSGPVDWNAKLKIGAFGAKPRRPILQLPELQDCVDSDDEQANSKSKDADSKKQIISPLLRLLPINTLQLNSQEGSKEGSPTKDSQKKSDPKASSQQQKPEPKPMGVDAVSPKKQTAQEQAKQSASQKKLPRQKKIKKHKNEANHVRLDLKRRYQDRFRGSLATYKQQYMRNGQLKFKYRKKPSELSEMELMASQSYDIYLHSISKALYLTFDMQDSEDDKEKPEKEEEPLDLNARSKPDLEKLIGRIWGFKQFRFGQFETISNILNQRSTMFVSETGSGKSLTYILSSILQEGLSIVISPLISLMLDQIESIPDVLPAACITSLLNRQQKQRIINMVKEGRIKLLYMTPEALQTDLVFLLKDFPPVNFVCVDEAHCVSELSHNFRTTYLIINELIHSHFKFKRQKTILCLTATANFQTVESVMQKMQIKELIKSNSLRPKNLCISISRDQDVYRSLIDYLHTDQVRKLKGILVYCRTRKISADTFNFLTNSGFKAAMFHAGLEMKEKTQLMQDFRTGAVKVVVATIALGMGLDFENLDCVVHINMPKSIESYVQEMGRAGRRGKRAYCHLFLQRNDYFMERNYIIADGIEEEGIKHFLSRIEWYTNICARQASNKRIQEQSEGEDDDKEKAKEQRSKKKANLKRNPTEKKRKTNEEDDDDLQQLAEMAKQHKQETLQSMHKQGVICFARTDKLSEELDLRSESIITVLLKIENLSNKQLLKVLPPSHQILKISFYSSNHDKIKKQSQFYKELTSKARHFKGSVHVRLIDRCNDMHIDPIDAISELQKLSNIHYLRLEYEHEVVLWRYLGQMSFDAFNRNHSAELLAKIVEVERNALTKLKIMFSLAFLNSYQNVQQMIRKHPQDRPRIPQNSEASVSDLFDKYFSSEPDEFYESITKGEYYLPSWDLEPQDTYNIDAAARMFLQHQLDIGTQLSKKDRLKPFLSGRVVTRVLMGVNTQAYNWKTYGQHAYWQKFRDKQYQQVLQQVKKSVTRFMEQST